MMRKMLFAGAAGLALWALAGPASAQEASQPEAALGGNAASDPWEGANRRLFAVHEGVDQAAVEPIARGYRRFTPGFFRAGVRNVLRNLAAPTVFANDLLQAELPRAGTTAARFGLNSTFGLLGLVDVATDMGLPYHDEDFGQTLAVWGVGAGPYVFVPLMGPTTVRDSVGRVVDASFNPLSYAEFDGEDAFRATRITATALSARESLLDPIDAVRANAIDPYASIRSGYFLTRESAIRNGLQDVEDLPEFEDIEPGAPMVGEPPAPTGPGADAGLS